MESVELLRILDELKKIQDQIESYKGLIPVAIDRYRSMDIAELASAFAQAQGEFEPIFLDHDGHGRFFDYKFENSGEMLNKLYPILSKYGLSIAPYTEDINGAIILHTQLHHSSGQWRESRVRIVPLEDSVHSLSSMIDFMKKQQIKILLGIQPINEDDDGAAAMSKIVQEKDKGISLVVNAQKEQAKNSYEKITKEQLEALNYDLRGWPSIAEDIKKTLGIRVLADMAKEDYLRSSEKARALIYQRTQAGDEPTVF